MKVAISGGTGTIGAPVARRLVERGAQVVVLSRNAEGVPKGAEHRRVDLASGEGLEAALAGVEVVVDAANAQKAAQEVLVAGTKRLVEAGARAGVRHHLLISIVGVDLLPIAYYRAKVAQERVVEAGTVPWSILRATQFHDLLDFAFGAAAKWRLRPTGGGLLQPIDVEVAAAALAGAALGEPGGRLPEVAGPRVETLGELSGAWRAAGGRGGLPLPIPGMGRVGRGLKNGDLCNPDAAAGGPTFAEWLARG